MGMNLLRIARNAWITDHHRQQLLDEAKMTLRKIYHGNQGNPI